MICCHSFSIDRDLIRSSRGLRIVILLFFFLMIRRPPRSTQSRSSAASDVYKRQSFVPETGVSFFACFVSVAASLPGCPAARATGVACSPMSLTPPHQRAAHGAARYRAVVRQPPSTLHHDSPCAIREWKRVRMYSRTLSGGSFTVPGPLRTKKSPSGTLSIPFHFRKTGSGLRWQLTTQTVFP